MQVGFGHEIVFDELVMLGQRHDYELQNPVAVLLGTSETYQTSLMREAMMLSNYYRTDVTGVSKFPIIPQQYRQRAAQDQRDELYEQPAFCERRVRGPPTDPVQLVLQHI